MRVTLEDARAEFEDLISLAEVGMNIEIEGRDGSVCALMPISPAAGYEPDCPICNSANFGR